MTLLTQTAGPERRRRVTRWRGLVAICVAAFSLCSGSAVVGADALNHTSSLLGRFFGRSEEPLTQYRAFRRMHAWSEKFKQEAWLDAWTEMQDGRFAYQVVEERGSDTIRHKVLRAVLAREQELINDGNTAKAEITPENYEFTEEGRDADGSRFVQIKPRRKDVLLVDGRMVLSPDGHDLLRIEGRLSKNPSFWTSLVNVVRHYARLGGVRVPVAIESTAKVKLVGTSQLEMSYQYETVNNRPVSAISPLPAGLSRSAAR